MLSYELCKALKEVGWPQPMKLEEARMAKEFDDEAAGIAYFLNKLNQFVYYYYTKDNYCVVPTLSELIEACGDIILFKLPINNEWQSEDSNNGKWIAGPSSVYEDRSYLCAGEHFIDTDLRDSAVGESAIETVANLYLALNQTKDGKE